MEPKAGYDVTDFVAEGGDPRRLLQASVAVPAPAAPPTHCAEVRPEGMSWTTAADLAQKVGEVSWMWDGWLPLGYVTILAASAGDGKSAIALDLANRHLLGLDWPDGSRCLVTAPVVLVLDCEGCQGIWASRVRAWGVPADRLLFPGDGFLRVGLDDQQAVASIADAVTQLGAKLVIIDSLRAGLPGSIDENDSRIGSILALWSDLARDRGCAVLIVHHYGKSRRGESNAASSDRLRGSSAIPAVARVIMAVDRPQEADREEDPTMRLSVVKSNLSTIPPPLGFVVSGTGVEWCDAPRGPERARAGDKAVDFLRPLLQGGPLSVGRILAEAESEGVARNALVEVDGQRVVIPDPERAPILRRAFEWYATGTCSLEAVRRLVIEQGLTGRDGKPPSKSTLSHALHNVFYTGSFIWNDRLYQGDHEPLVSHDLYERTQQAFRKDGKPQVRPKHSFAYTGLIKCEHCGCAVTAERKKGKYVYYHCTGFRGGCDKPSIREEALEELLGEVVRAIAIDAETAAWIKQALRESHKDERAYHDEQIASLQGQYARLQGKIDAAYEDKLDGKISEEFWQRKSREWREEQTQVRAAVERHEGANQGYFEEGGRILDLASRAYDLWLQQPQEEKRKLLNLVLSNCTFDGETLRPHTQNPSAG